MFRLPADDLEYAVLRQLWELRVASVRELHERLEGRSGLVYTTIAKVVDRLREKGLVQRQRKGALFLYRPRVAPEAVERARAREALTRLFGPQPHGAVAALVQAMDEIDPQLLNELEQAVSARRRGRDGT
jgi:predicted transcriptional regulator